MDCAAERLSANDVHRIDGTYAARRAADWSSTSGSGDEAASLFHFILTHTSLADCRAPISQEQT
jgi:hypothetical protein